MKILWLFTWEPKISRFMKSQITTCLYVNIMLQTNTKLPTVFYQGPESYLGKTKKWKIKRKISSNAYGVTKPFQGVISSKFTLWELKNPITTNRRKFRQTTVWKNEDFTLTFKIFRENNVQCFFSYKYNDFT